mmetsp:Transcript_1164/g.2914  ORF Transcript_1164/g.2914 Transcript_1164/m.2914 type:complete len:149 (-) Transcript_1164:45-491(-)|eukprot:CAMPEP_0197429270 /NCGR_PEP_ID=MMETSP1170-20131217/43414_1 /TAXON_ID=54406 /ORGANISM="Sarcinochrysis sp, Strain CCMP770" /LENGTH=148 /DNA_ID=CAMNT_0042957095 /DNA_START=58 /DNA_END=504 /DNA_ORIENTATION=-
MAGSLLGDLPPLAGPGGGDDVGREIEGLITVDGPAAVRHAEAERDILDDHLDLLDACLAQDGVDSTTVEVAAHLMGKGDKESALRAHHVLNECGVHMGLWALGGTSPKTRRPHTRGPTRGEALTKLRPVPAWDTGRRKTAPEAKVSQS